MLSSYRNRLAAQPAAAPAHPARPRLAGPLAATLLVGPLVAGTAAAAEFYYQPIASLATSYNSNVLLTPGEHKSAEGYFADASTVLGMATPTSDTTLIPRLLYNYYPTETELNRVEGFLSLNSRYSWQRDKLTVVGYFDHRDDLNAELPGAYYNTTTPGVGGTTQSTGHVQLGTVRDFLDLIPTYSHYVTPLNIVGVSAEYQRMHYNPDDQRTHVDYNYYLGRAFYTYTVSPRLDATLSGFGSRYVASNIDSTSTSGGGTVQLAYNWTQALNSVLSTSYQRTRLLETEPRQFNSNTGPWSATFQTTYAGQVSQYRVDVGRTIGPSSAGGLYKTDQVRGQYTRSVTQRLNFSAGVRYFRDGTLTGIVGDDRRYYLTTNVNVQYMLTQRIFVSGAYSYVWEKYHVDPSGEATNIATFTIGYRGLERQH